MKVCSCCKKEKPESEFGKFWGDKLQSRCKECFRKTNKKYYQKNKFELINFMGGKCIRCGLTLKDAESCLGVFTIDEIKRLNEINRSRRFAAGLSKKRLRQAKQLFLDGKIQLLCANCSMIKSWKNNDYGKRNI